jgi:hypothetical protein
VLRETRKRLAERFGDDAALSGEGQWDAATEYLDFTWDWHFFDAKEIMAPFHMAFPRARQCMKCTDYIPQINRIFTAGYWLDMWLEDGQAKLADYPELTEYLASLARFKERFSRFFNQRDAYLHTLGSQCDDPTVWIRGHRSGDEALVMVADVEGDAKEIEIRLDPTELIGAAKAVMTVWSRQLEETGRLKTDGTSAVRLELQENDFVAVHATPA